MDIAEILHPERKLACITLDFETDYGDRINGAFNILQETSQLADVAALYRECEVPVSAFIRTDLLEREPASIELVRELAVDFHCHSHTHATGDRFISDYEISRTQEAFCEVFGEPALGYRAPRGVLYDGDVDLVLENGFKFSSSIFPTFFPGRFNYRKMPSNPFVYENGLIELPFAAVHGLRYTVSLSFVKLLGMTLNRALYALCGLPPIVVFDSHLHDYVLCDASYSQLPSRLQFAWGINKNAGMPYFAQFVEVLRAKGYEFITMTQLYEYVRTLTPQTPCPRT